MRGVWLLSWRHIRHQRLQTSILVAAIALSLFLPATVQCLATRYRADMTGRAAGTPLVAGARGNRVDLTLGALYFRHVPPAPIPFGQVEALEAGGGATAIPMHLEFTARGQPLVATTPEYFELRGLRAARGTLPLQLGEVTLGAGVAGELGLGVGDALFSDPTDLYDISRPPALRMRVVGVLPETGSADDDAVFTPLGTAWILEGLAHGHDDARELPEEVVLKRVEGAAALAPTVTEYVEVTPDNVASFHHHGDRAAFPLSAIVLVPRDDKAATLLKARVNAAGEWQVLVPRLVVDELMETVFRIKQLLDLFTLLLGGTTVLMLVLEVLLSLRLRARELTTLHRIGCSRGTVFRMCAAEIALLLGAGVCGAAVATALALDLLPNLVLELW